MKEFNIFLCKYCEKERLGQINSHPTKYHDVWKKQLELYLK